MADQFFATETCVDQPGPSVMNPALELDLAGRRELIEQISENAVVGEIDSVVWAFLWLADMSVLRPLAEMAKNIPGSTPLCSSYLKRDYYPALKDWLSKSRNTNAANSAKRKEPPTESESPRGAKSVCKTLEEPLSSTHSTNDAATRDQNKCIITKAGEPIEIAHLISSALGVRHQRKKEQEEFWDILSCFWSAERIERWQSVFFENGTETPKNLLCLSRQAHRLWDTARFAFRPVRCTKTELELEFYWLPDAVRKDVKPCDKPIIGLYRASPKNCKLFHCDTEEIITSGYVIKVTTPDPDRLPLPSFEVLEMQWYLHRVAAISGAADFVEDSDDDDDDNDDVDREKYRNLNH